MSMQAQNRLLSDWLTRIRTRQLALPRFQRHEAWGHGNVAQMFNTLLRGLPIGSLLVLEVGDTEPFISRTIVGAPSTGEKINEHLLDGQQRLTAIWRALHNNYEDQIYFIKLNDEEEGQPYSVQAFSRYKVAGEEEYRPLWTNKSTEQWQRKLIPLDLCRPGDEAVNNYKAWAKEAIPDFDERETITEAVSKIRTIFHSYNIPFLSLPVQTPKDTALDVFIKMNTSAAALKTYDIVVAQMEAAMGESLHDLIAECRIYCPEIERYYDLENLVLYASALLQDKAPSNTTYLTFDFGKNLKLHWQELKCGIKETVAFLMQEKIFDNKRLPSEVVIPVLTALWTVCDQKTDKKGFAYAVLQKYMWRVFFTNRYESSTNSRSLVDYQELSKFIKEETNAPLPLIFNDNQYPLPEKEILINAGWPKHKQRLARAILAISLKNGAKDFADGTEISIGNLDQREYHHLYPVAMFNDEILPKRDDNQIFRVLNCALVTWQTNRTIAAKSPEIYLAERLERGNISEDLLKERLTSHLIPYDAMLSGDYDHFIDTRAEMIDAEMRKLCSIEHNWKKLDK